MLALIITAAVVALLLLLLVIPIRVHVAFQQEFTLTVRYLFLSWKLFPAAEAEPVEEEQQPEVTESSLEKIKKALKRREVKGFVKSLLELINIVAKSTKRIVRRVKLKSFDLYLCLGSGGDVGEAAMRYGEISGAVYSACGMLFGITNCRKKGVTVDLDYQAPEDKVVFTAVVSVLPIFALKEGLSLIIKALPVFKDLMRPDTKTTIKQKERASQQRTQGEQQ